MRTLHDHHPDSLLRWEDFADNRVPGAQLRMARSVIGLPHWTMEQGGVAQGSRGKQPVSLSLLKRTQVALRRFVTRLFDATHDIRAKRTGMEKLALMDERLLRDIGLEPLDIAGLVAGELSLKELDARRRSPELLLRAPDSKCADVVILEQGQREMVEQNPIRQAA